MNLLRLVDSVQDNLKRELFQVRDRVADHMSQWPDPADLEIQLGSIRTAQDAIASIIALELALPGTRTRHQVFDQREYLAKLVLAHRREGEWKVVESLLQQPQGLYFLLRELDKNYSPEDIFGNIVPKIKRRLRNARPRSKKLSAERRERNRLVKKPIRRRGYRDKGSLRSNPALGPFDPKIKPELPEQPPVKIAYPKPYQWVPPEKTKTRRGDESGISSNLSTGKTNLFH